MKLIVALSLLVATASAGILPALQHRFPLMPVMPLAELEERITNGEIAEPGQFPYQVGLSLVFGNSGAWCGGTLISDRWIVTAAHCTDSADGVTVYLGATNIKDDNEKGQQRIYTSKSNIIVHADWDPTTLTNDISVIKLPVSIRFTDHIKPATLPKYQSDDKYSTYDGDKAWASGWGKDTDSATTVSQYLRYIEVPILKQSSCSKYYAGLITSKMICINTTGHKSTCNGDSGGPLVYKDGDINYLIGATSFGISFGCEKGWPGVFTRITSYLDWIHEKTGVINK